MKKKYDYIIAGSGCAGLSLAYKISKDPFFKDVSVLLIDQDLKQKNDRTWCHWSKTNCVFDPIVHKSWSTITVHNNEKKIIRDIRPYTYKMIRGIDFYNFVLSSLKNNEQLDFLHANIKDIVEEDDKLWVNTESGAIEAKRVFKSYTEIPPNINDHFVLQHFKGYFIRSETDFFKENEIRFMDFRTPQKNEVRFFYVLPTSKKEALIELAIFSNELLNSASYDKIIEDYIRENLKALKYEIVESEMGSIPMTTYSFPLHQKSKITPIGTAAGCIKPSSGFAFERIQDHTDQLINLLKNNKNPNTAQNSFKSRFNRYDKTFMNVLLSHKASGDKVFMDLFSKLPPQLVFKFLDEDTHFLEELRLFTAPPTLPFMKAFLEEQFGS